MTRIEFAIKLGLFLFSFSHHTRGRGQETWAVKYTGNEESLRQILAHCSVKHLFDDYYRVSADIEQEDVENFLLSHHEFSWVEMEETTEKDVALPVPVAFPAAETYSASLFIDDPKWAQQWYLHNTSGGVDMNVTGAWDKGYTGANVVVAVIDSDVRHNSELTQRTIGSLEVLDNDASPYLGFSHGTSVAGIIAAERNNSFCGSGIAPKADILSMKIFPNNGASSKASDEAMALQANMSTVDIYHNSWTASNTGAYVATPSKMVTDAVKKGIKQGRGGKGAIYVWSAGNGGTLDGCAYDGYLNHPYAIVVTGVTRNLQRLASTGERCPAVMVTAFSSDVTTDEKNPIVTPEGDSGCTELFGRSSAASPMVSGAVALALHANPSLTYRDVMHILVRTSRSHVFADSPHYDFIQNAAGRNVSPSFGFGLLDIGGVANLAETWNGNDVKARTTCHILLFKDKFMPVPRTSNITFPVDTSNCSITSLEHIEVNIKAIFKPRGDLKVSLESPGQTKTDILSGRPMDFFADDLDLKVMALTFWDEEATGYWNVTFADLQGDKKNNKGSLTSLSVTLYGQGDGSEKSSGPYITKLPDRPPPVKKNNHGLLAGIILGSVGGVLLVTLLIFFIWIKMKGFKKRRVSGIGSSNKNAL